MLVNIEPVLVWAPFAPEPNARALSARTRVLASKVVNRYLFSNGGTTALRRILGPVEDLHNPLVHVRGLAVRAYNAAILIKLGSLVVHHSNTCPSSSDRIPGCAPSTMIHSLGGFFALCPRARTPYTAHPV